MSHLIVTNLNNDNPRQTTMANIALSQDVELQILPTSNAASLIARRLERALIGELEVIGGVKVENAAIGDHRLKGLLLVSDGASTSNENAENVTLAFQNMTPAKGFVLPIVPIEARSNLAKLVPKLAHKYNAALWKASLREVITAIFRRAGISYNHPAVFISYKQTDTAELAIQIFDALGHAGFDVFLDKFRIPPGVDFQAELTQELGEKSMLLVLESKTLSKSKWVKHEISVAKACGLGVMGLHLQGCPTESSIDLRIALKRKDQKCNSERIKEQQLPRIIAEIVTQIDRINVLRRQSLEASLRAAATEFECDVESSSAGSFILEKDLRKRQIWLTTRPPNTPDFYKAHAYSDATPISIVGLTRLWRLERANLANWLSNLSEMSLIDTDYLVGHVGDFAKGTL